MRSGYIRLTNCRSWLMNLAASGRGAVIEGSCVEKRTAGVTGMGICTSSSKSRAVAKKRHWHKPLPAAVRSACGPIRQVGALREEGKKKRRAPTSGARR